MNLLSDLLIGVVSGIIAAGLVLFFSRVWDRVIVPWYEDRVYQDIRVNGTWEAAGTENGRDFTEVVVLRQQAHHVWGQMTYTGTNSKGEKQTISYDFDGEFRNLILSGRHWLQHELDRGTFTLMAANGGRELRGHYAWYLDEQGAVISGAYVWRRK